MQTMSETSPAVAASYRHCQAIARRAASNFYWSFWLLPTSQRQAMCALYAFARKADDLADDGRTADERRGALNSLRERLQAALAGDASAEVANDPLLPALVDTVARYGIPQRYLLEILSGVAMDLEPIHFETFAELRNYCYHVASAVGLACLHIWGFTGDDALAPAIDCGIAMQLTNILRDLREDADRGRIYLPREELAQFGYATNLSGFAADARFLPLMQFQIERAQQFYRSGATTLGYLQPTGRRVFRLMFGTYDALLTKIERRPRDVLQARIRIGLSGKLAVLARCLLRTPLA
jgi:phytoene synthase